MYGHVSQLAEVTCMSDSLPTLFRNANRYERRLALTANGVSVTETSDDPRLTAAIRAHARERARRDAGHDAQDDGWLIA